MSRRSAARYLDPLAKWLQPELAPESIERSTSFLSQLVGVLLLLLSLSLNWWVCCWCRVALFLNIHALIITLHWSCCYDESTELKISRFVLLLILSLILSQLVVVLSELLICGCAVSVSAGLCRSHNSMVAWLCCVRLVAWLCWCGVLTRLLG